MILFRKADMYDCPKKQAVLPEFEVDCNKIREVCKQNIVCSAADLAINGNDLIDIGIEKGPMFGKILAYLCSMAIDDPSINTKETLLLIAKKYKEDNEVG
jgi:hypothetical protein